MSRPVDLLVYYYGLIVIGIVDIIFACILFFKSRYIQKQGSPINNKLISLAIAHYVTMSALVFYTGTVELSSSTLHTPFSYEIPRIFNMIQTCWSCVITKHFRYSTLALGNFKFNIENSHIVKAQIVKRLSPLMQLLFGVITLRIM